MSTAATSTPDSDDPPGLPAAADVKGAPAASPSPGSVVRARTWLIGLPLLVGLSIVSVYADMSSQVIQFGVLAFSPPAVVALFALALLNASWTAARKRPLLSGAEMLVIYAMLLVGVMVSTRGVVEKLAGAIAYLPYGIAQSNPEFKPFLAHVPRWIVPYDPNATTLPAIVRDFYEGKASVPWSQWLEPLAADFLLFALVALVFLCLGTILRRPWVDVEHLNFPLTAIPISLIRNESDGRPLLSNPLLRQALPC